MRPDGMKHRVRRAIDQGLYVAFALMAVTVGWIVGLWMARNYERKQGK